MEFRTKSPFIDQKQVVITLIADLGRLQAFSQKLKLDSSVKLIEDVINRAKQQSFSVAIVGDFNRGKSTLINALLGADILPSDILPCSATLNRITHGLKPQLKIKFKDRREEKLEIDRLKDYVTKLTDESEEMASTIEEATIYYPIRHDNVEIIDTPGLNDDDSMTAVTYSVIPKVDAAVMVMMAPVVFAQNEKDFLENQLMTNDLGRVIFVVNAIDRCESPEEKERLLNNAVNRIKKYTLSRAEEQFGKDSEDYKVYIRKISTPKVFGVSARQALAAKLNGDQEALVQSGFAEFQTALEEFLTTGAGAVGLQVAVNRAIASGNEILNFINIRENSLAMEQEDFDAAYHKSVAEIAAIREKKKEEMILIDRATENVRDNVRPLLKQLEDKIKQAAEQTIENTTVEKGELRNKKALTNKLAKAVSNSVQHVGEQMANQIQSEIQHGLEREIDRLKEFGESVNQTLKQIEMNFVEVDADANRKLRGGGEAIAIAVSVFTGFGGIWSGYKKAGLKGAAVGGAGSLATSFGAGVVIAMLGLPVTWPAILAIGVASIFTGGWLTDFVFSGDRIEAFKTNYKEATLTQIEKQLKSNPIHQQVEEQISQTFDSLKQTLNQEVEALLDNTQNTLLEMSRQRGSDLVQTETESRELSDIRTETERILGNAQRLSDELIQILSV
ncbi:MAG TPA: dynamin family protein [Cyanobacteria bacterium UBA11149]|nr:dynamin family protein [Cyanobacteria bacterium UBA11367]HBE56407.1 dynamin family protein [Cyanobacteria bacterium UBA11366]HBK64356.1 dynamin family protein [Cyanobacteria bacterium UBA11166]HBR72571.1 dynamin family protein [Cyanobacteria bacterium UBA11159]HBS68677.1 dynamin family protein [Cyanobacteria bacterium UBA11153]HBW87995.1 dynamin family protein [Cyanobacteria bacterium UBA11149]HCA95134.1 dynamin family protein [Cyanobacteria bacterium UBA9226]